ncbi:unnamed protein product [Cylindrotheca closterium]|uniref:Ketoreductase domain-containing protein n=1 Tax=Cylindrotheca closterium TaxID=2856 RepID=A0AAD2FQI2_9STRA|nr:unnamed protein product [Cylindrotheca closterium]
MTGKLSGKVAIVTGGTSGMGKATALMFAKEGAKAIVLVSRTQAKLEEVAKEIEAAGTKVAIVAGDVGSEDTAKKMVAAAKEFGAVDVAFLNAGMYASKKNTEIEESDIDGVFNANYKSVAWGLKHVLPAMKDSPGKGSVIVNTSCMGSVARATFAGSSMYSAAKAGADMLVQYAAKGAAEDGTRVNAVAPGIVATNIADMDEETTNGWAKGAQLVGRAGKSDEVASVVTMLASDDGTFLTGMSSRLTEAGLSRPTSLFILYKLRYNKERPPNSVMHTHENNVHVLCFVN